MIELNFLCEINILARLKQNATFVLMCLVFPIYISDQKFENSMDLLLVIDENKSHYCISKISADFCFLKQRIKTKSIFARVVYSILVVKMY